MTRRSRDRGWPTRRKLEEILRAAPVIPVITIERARDAVPLARALVAGGLKALEITLRTPAAPAAAEAIVREVPEAMVGLGTVLTAQDLDTARTLNARFALSPGATPELLDAAAQARSAVHSRRADRLRADGRARARLRRRQVLPGRSGRRDRGLARAGRPLSAGAVLPDGRRRRGQLRRLAGAAQRRLRRRLVAGAGGRHPQAGNWAAITARARQAVARSAQYG